MDDVGMEAGSWMWRRVCPRNSRYCGGSWPGYGPPFCQGLGASAGGGAELGGAGPDVQSPGGGPLAAAADGKGVRVGIVSRTPASAGPCSASLLRMPKGALPELRGAGLTVASVDGKTMRGVWEDGWRLRLRHMFSREGALALDRMRICGHPEEPRAAQEWMEQVSGSVFVPERGRGCGY